MDKEKLIKRVAELENYRDTIIAQLNQIEGAILDTKYWIEQLDKPDFKGDIKDVVHEGDIT